MSESIDSGRLAGQRGEKTMFSQTCNLLREYLKEKGPLGELSLGMTIGLESNPNPNPNPNAMPEPYRVASSPAINLFQQFQNATMLMNGSMSLFPQQAGLANSPAKEVDAHRSNGSEPGKAQMTIFYAGQVIVFDDFPAEKAKEVMTLASMGSSKAPPSTPSNMVINHSEATTNLIPAGSLDVKPNLLNNFSQERSIQTRPPVVCGLARKASLTRFLAKRKDRIQARAPYEVSTPSSSDPSKPIESSKSWLGLASQS